MARTPIAEGLFTWPADRPQLISCRCGDCGQVAFPSQPRCPSCGGATAEHLLGRRGTLHTWTTQHFPPIAPPYEGGVGEAFEPFGIGWVSLPGELMVEARLTVADPGLLAFDMPVELVIVPFAERDGDEVVTFAFAPIAT